MGIRAPVLAQGEGGGWVIHDRAKDCRVCPGPMAWGTRQFKEEGEKVMFTIEDQAVQRVCGGVQPGDAGDSCTPDPFRDVLNPSQASQDLVKDSSGSSTE